MHVYKLEADNMHLQKQIKELTDQVTELQAKIKSDTSKILDGIIVLIFLKNLFG